MKFAIIAAGEGSRLAAEGMEVPKPLVQVGGECLIDRLIRIFMQQQAEEIVCICNDYTTQVSSHLLSLQRDGLLGCPVPLRFVVRRTPSSMHSFFEISKYLDDGPFVLTTVDTIFNEQEFSAYVEAFRKEPCAALMGVTDYIDDERPLYVETDKQMNVTSFLDQSDTCRYVSAGIYGLHPSACQAAGLHGQDARHLEGGSIFLPRRHRRRALCNDASLCTLQRKDRRTVP
jgi:NDP-sugar pyrophosphorylase family protein